MPADLAVVGFGDLAFAADLYPALTTVRSQLESAGRRAATSLIALVDGAQPDDPAQLLDTTLVVRASTGPAPTT